MAAVVVLLAASAPVWAGDNPGYDRPGLGFAPAVLGAGEVTWEQGLPDWSHAGGASLYTADTLLRLGIGGPFELQWGTSYNHLAASRQHPWGWGSSSLGLKFALPARGDFSWGLLGSVGFTDGAHEFRNGRRQYLLGAVASWQLNPSDAVGAYLENVRSGGRTDHLIAVNAGRAWTDALGVYVEAAWQHAAGTGNGRMAGAGVTLMASSRVQLDASFRHRLGGTAAPWQGGLGMSVYFGGR